MGDRQSEHQFEGWCGMKWLFFEQDFELAAFAKSTADGDLSIEGVAEVLDDGESQSGAAAFAGAVSIDAVEAFEDAFEEWFGDTFAGVFDSD